MQSTTTALRQISHSMLTKRQQCPRLDSTRLRSIVVVERDREDERYPGIIYFDQFRYHLKDAPVGHDLMIDGSESLGFADSGNQYNISNGIRRGAA